VNSLKRDKICNLAIDLLRKGAQSESKNLCHYVHATKNNFVFINCIHFSNVIANVAINKNNGLHIFVISNLVSDSPGLKLAKNLAIFHNRKLFCEI